MTSTNTTELLDALKAEIDYVAYENSDLHDQLWVLTSAFLVLMMQVCY